MDAPNSVTFLFVQSSRFEGAFAFWWCRSDVLHLGDTWGVGEVLRLLPRTTFVSVLLLSGETDNHAVVDRPHPELKTYEDPFPDVRKPPASRIDSWKTFSAWERRRRGSRVFEAIYVRAIKEHH